MPTPLDTPSKGRVWWFRVLQAVVLAGAAYYLFRVAAPQWPAIRQRNLAWRAGPLALSALLFNAGALTALTQTLCWCVIFFFASAGASAGYLTVSEIFPLEVRAKAIAVFFAIAQCFGALGPVVYGALIGTGDNPFQLFIGYLIGAAVMIVGGLVTIAFGVAAEGKSLEDIAAPLAARRPGSTRAEGSARPTL